MPAPEAQEVKNELLSCRAGRSVLAEKREILLHLLDLQEELRGLPASLSIVGANDFLEDSTISGKLFCRKNKTNLSLAAEDLPTLPDDFQCFFYLE